MNNKLVFILLFGLFVFFFTSCKKENSENQKVVKGVINLSDFDKDKIYTIQGDWEFYWNKLLKPSEIRNLPSDSVNYTYVNNGWNDFIYNGQKIKGFGFATYRLKIIAPQGLYTIKFRQILSAYKVWINDKLVSQVGNPGDINTHNAKILPNEIVFRSVSDTIEVVLQVSNYSHRVGGIQELVTIGKPNVITERVKNSLNYSFFILGSEAIFALYFLLTFFFRRKNIAYLYFSFSILTSLLFEIVNNEMFFMRVLSEISSFELIKKIDFLCNYTRLTFFSLFFWAFFKDNKIINKYVFSVILSISVILDLYVLFTPCRLYSETLMFFMAFGLISFLYFTFSLLYGLFKKVKNIVFSFIGMLIFNIGLINDILFNLNVINSIYLLNTGLLIFFIMQSIILALNYSYTQSSVNILSNRFIVLDRLRNSFLNITSYDLPKALEIISAEYEADKIEILVYNNKKTYCESKKQDGSILFAQMEQNLTSDFDENLFIDSTVKSKNLLFHKDEFSVFSMPLIQNEEIKAVLLLGRIKKFTKEELTILEDISSHISVIFENYNYFWTLDKINKNLEFLIDKRTKLAYKQKDELIAKTFELDEKIEELNISSKIVDDLNQELITNRREITEAQQKLMIQQQEINSQKLLLTDKTKNINSSINYAQKIHKTLFRINQRVDNTEIFEFAKPKDIVSGDFWGVFKSANKIYVTLVDSTGQNVSGTFLSFLILSFIEEIIIDNFRNDLSSADILYLLKNKYLKFIGAEKTSRLIQDSFDISLVAFDNRNNVLEFSGAGQPALIVRKGENIFLEPDISPVGGHQHFFDNKYKNKKIEYKKNDTVYLFSDGFSNQITKETKQKFGINNFLLLLNSISPYAFDKQKHDLNEKFDELLQNIRQIDDVLVVGVKFNI